MGKVYTKSGDDGLTVLASGKRVKKSADVIELCGCLDELNAFLGYAAESLCYNQDFRELIKLLYRVQRELFELGLHLTSGNKFTINPHKITKLETEIDELSAKLPVLKSFILPGGGECAARLHLARAVCRRVERVAFRVTESNSSAEIIAVYLNRLSDWIYTVARTAALIANTEEMVWEHKA